jgi:hypothetical protein
MLLILVVAAAVAWVASILVIAGVCLSAAEGDRAMVRSLAGQPHEPVALPLRAEEPAAPAGARIGLFA